MTCSRERTREIAAIQSSQTVLREMQTNGLMGQFILFDNASSHTGHMEIWPEKTNLLIASKNIGYWSAINWVLHNHQDILGRSFKYIYIMESDCLQYNIYKLASCEKWLDGNPDAGAVRCQEYSRRFWFLYDKRYSCLPFHKIDSAVAHYNGATHEKIVFGAMDRATGIFKTNFHSKLPALNRMCDMMRVFDCLALKRHFDEGDFMLECQELFQVVGVLNGGTYRSMGNDPLGKLISGSYSSPELISKIGYRATREDNIETKGFEVSRY